MELFFLENLVCEVHMCFTDVLFLVMNLLQRNVKIVFYVFVSFLQHAVYVYLVQKYEYVFCFLFLFAMFVIYK